MSSEWNKKKRAEENFIKAREYEMIGYNHLALHFYESAYDLDPKSQTLRDLLVEKYMVSSRYNQALLLIKGNKKNNELSDGNKRMLADIYMRLGKFGNVSELLEQIKDKRTEEYYTLGLIYESQGNMAKAAREYSGYLRKNPESLQMWLKTAGLYTKLKQYDAAESLFVGMERRFGQVPELFNGIGMMKLARQDTVQALNSFKMALLIDSTYEEAVRTIAQIQIHRSQWAQAIAGYEKLYNNDSLGDVYGKTLALLYYYNNQYAKASQLIHRLLAENIDDYEVHFYCGLVLAAQDSVDLARMEFEKTLVLRNTFADAWQQLCYLALKEKDLGRALATAKRFENAMPKNAESWHMEGFVLNAKNEYDHAIVSLKKAIALDSTDALAWFELGSSLERTKNRDRAELAFKRVLALRQADPQAANYLGYMWAEAGIKLDSAQTLIKMALQQDSLNGAYLDSYAWVFYKKGETDSAFVYIVKAIKGISDDPVVFSHYGDILAKKGDAAGALAAYRKGLGLAPEKATSEEINDLKNKIKSLESSVPGPGQPSGIVPEIRKP
jgi:Flp pilus assembly protein TadD, contains TPR repeats